MKSLTDEYGPIFGVDSKKHIRQWESEGEIKEFRGNIGVVINPEDIKTFEEKYHSIMKDLFDSFGVKMRKKVYKSHEIGQLFPGNPEKIRAFHIGFAREILNLKDLRVNYFFTTINTNYLEDEKVTVFGEYGRPTRKKDVKKFIDMIGGYYNVLCAWKLTDITSLRNCTFLFDGVESIYPTKAWDNLKSSNNIKIVYSGDHTDPLISTADILVKHLDFFLKEDYNPLNEETIENIVTYGDKVDSENIFYHYIGNPDLEHIKPIRDRQFNLMDLQEHIRRPIIFVSKGSVPKQRKALENLPIYYDIFDKAYSLQASVRIYDPGKDSQIIGKDPDNPDYFLPLTREADEQFELLKRGGANIKKLEI